MPSPYEAERMRILEMLEQGSITSVEAVQLLEALTGSAPANIYAGEREESPSSTALGSKRFDEGKTVAEAVDSPVPAQAPNLDEWRQWWRYPLAIGALFAIAGGILMYQAARIAGYGVWFFCSWLPLTLGLVIMGFAWYSRTARWLHIRIHQGSGEWPQRIALSFPLPIRFTARLLRRFGSWIPHLEDTSIDELLLALDESTSADQPFYVEVEDNEDGDRVQVFIG